MCLELAVERSGSGCGMIWKWQRLWEWCAQMQQAVEAAVSGSSHGKRLCPVAVVGRCVAVGMVWPDVPGNSHMEQL
jgi:hypothetical protein